MASLQTTFTQGRYYTAAAQLRDRSAAFLRLVFPHIFLVTIARACCQLSLVVPRPPILIFFSLLALYTSRKRAGPCRPAAARRELSRGESAHVAVSPPFLLATLGHCVFGRVHNPTGEPIHRKTKMSESLALRPFRRDVAWDDTQLPPSDRAPRLDAVGSTETEIP